MPYRVLMLAWMLTMPAVVAAQASSDSVAVMSALATAIRGDRGGSILLRGDEGVLLDGLATSLGTRRAREGELPNCGGTVAPIGRGPMSKAGAYVIQVGVPEFAGDSAVVRIGRRCMNTMGGRRATFAKDEVLVFRRETAGWALVNRAMKTS